MSSSSSTTESSIRRYVVGFQMAVPKYFKNSKSVYTLTSDSRLLYKDNLSFFRALICAIQFRKADEKINPHIDNQTRNY